MPQPSAAAQHTDSVALDTPSGYVEYRAPFQKAGNPKDAVAYLDARATADFPPAERAGDAIIRGGIEVPPETVDPRVPVGVEAFDTIDAILRDLSASERSRIAEIENDRDLRGTAALQRKLQARQTNRLDVVKPLSEQFERGAKAFLHANAPRTYVFSNEESGFLNFVSNAISAFTPDDALLIVEHAARSNPALLDVAHSTLRRISLAPPRAWKEIEPGSTTSAALRAMMLLDSLPPAPRAAAMERYRRAEEIVTRRRAHLAASVARFVALGRV